MALFSSNRGKMCSTSWLQLRDTWVHSICGLDLTGAWVCSACRLDLKGAMVCSAWEFCTSELALRAYYVSALCVCSKCQG